MKNNTPRLLNAVAIAASALIFIALFFCCALAQKPQRQDLDEVADASAAVWKEFSSKEGGFSVQFPGAPTQSSQQMGDFTLKLFQLHTAFEYSVMYADYPSWANDEDPALAKKILDDGLAGAVAEVKSKLLEVEEISLQKHPGRQYTERMPNGNILRGKTFLAGNRLYQIAITTPKEEGKIPEAIQFYQVTANKFLGSFRLIAQ